MPVRHALAEMVGPNGRANPYPWYEVLRAHGDLIDVKPGLAVAVGYQACNQVLRHPALHVQDAAAYDSIFPRWREHSSLRGYIDSMLYTNPPDHTRLRRLVSTGLTAHRVASLRPAIEAMSDRLLDRLADAGSDGSPVDFVMEFASRLPIAVISFLLGVPEEDQGWFREVAARVTLALEGITNTAALGTADQGMDELGIYFDDLIAQRRARPRDDIATVLVAASESAPTVDGEVLTQAELVGNMMLMLTAGFETTSFLLGSALMLLFERPHLIGRLRDEPTFASAYVEETLRFESPVQATSRWAARDVDLPAGWLAAGTKVVAMLGAGNRDPERYPQPAVFDPDRSDVQPLSFGAGSHFCLGAPLSRLEAQIALPRLVRRFPRLSPAGQPRRRDTWVGRGLDEQPIRVV